MEHVKRTFFRTVGDDRVEVVLDTADLEIGDDLVAESRTVAARMGIVTDLVSEYTFLVQTCEAQYRTWSGSESAALSTRNDKLAEWKVKALVESAKGFFQHKKNVAEATADLVWLQGHHENLKTKSYKIDSIVELEKLDRGRV